MKESLKEGDYLLYGFTVTAVGTYRDVYAIKKYYEFSLYHNGIIETVWSVLRRGFWEKLKHRCLWILNFNVNKTVGASKSNIPYLISEADEIKFEARRRRSGTLKRPVFITCAINGMAKWGVDIIYCNKYFHKEIKP